MLRVVGAYHCTSFAKTILLLLLRVLQSYGRVPRVPFFVFETVGGGVLPFIAS